MNPISKNILPDETKVNSISLEDYVHGYSTHALRASLMLPIYQPPPTIPIPSIFYHTAR